jgi:hypothetical protein
VEERILTARSVIYCSPLAEDRLLQASTPYDTPKQRLETIMIFGKKTDVKKHFSSKHSAFSHKLFVEDKPNETTGTVPGEEQSAAQPQAAKVEKPEVNPTK